MVTRVPSVSNVATARLRDSRRFCSSGSKSRWELPSSTLPTRPTAPALNRSCSPSVVLPAPAGPANTPFRRGGRSTLLLVIGDAILVQWSHGLGARTGALRRPPEGFRHSSPDILAADVRTLQMVDQQAREGRESRKARRCLHEGGTRDHGRRPCGRRLSR